MNRNRKHSLLIFGLLIFELTALLAVTGCATTFGTSASVTGTITYRERLALTPDARVEIKLLDTSLADVAATEVATRTINNPGQVPIAFEVEYDPDDIKEGMTYTVRADIYDRDKPHTGR